jgi:hypothetical protein
VAASIDSPAGSGPEIEYVVLVGEVASIETLIALNAEPTVPVSLAEEVVTANGVVKVLAVEAVPSPLLFAAVAVTE